MQPSGPNGKYTFKKLPCQELPDPEEIKKQAAFTESFLAFFLALQYGIANPLHSSAKNDHQNLIRQINLNVDNCNMYNLNMYQVPAFSASLGL